MLFLTRTHSRQNRRVNIFLFCSQWTVYYFSLSQRLFLYRWLPKLFIFDHRAKSVVELDWGRRFAMLERVGPLQASFVEWRFNRSSWWIDRASWNRQAEWVRASLLKLWMLHRRSIKTRSRWNCLETILLFWCAMRLLLHEDISLLVFNVIHYGLDNCTLFLLSLNNIDKFNLIFKPPFHIRKQLNLLFVVLGSETDKNWS